ncbi:MAG TPA: heme-binding protein [Pseudolabrys sp.]|nr:heme-binding protein [Pseudolabrys sp.]
MSGIVKALGALAAAGLLTTQAHAQALTQKNVSEAMAQAIATAALARCQNMGFKVSVVVIDRDGLQVVMLRDDGAGLHTPEGADRKAYTARTYRSPSADFAKRVQAEPAYAPATQYTRVLALAGGLPIKVGDDVIGAVGVSGSPGKDDVCGQAGLDKVADQLK